MYLAIDGRRVIRQPHSIELQPYGHETGMTADQRPTVRPGSDHVVLNMTWGDNASYQDVLGELDRLRANRGVHAVTFEPMRGQQFLTINAWMGKPRYTMVRYDGCGQIITSAFTVPFVQVDTPTFLYAMRFSLKGILAVMAPFTRRLAPAAGRIIGVNGSIADLGSGAGQTSIQVSNGATNYLSVEGDFINSAPPNFRLQNQVLGTSLDFAQDDPLDIDVTDIPAGGLSKWATIFVWCWLYRP